MTTLHVSPEDLERYVANELEGETLEAFEAHIASCDECAAALAEFAREELAFHAMWRQDAFCAGCGRPVDGETCGFCGALVALEGYAVLKVLKESSRGRTYLARTESGDNVVIKEMVFGTAVTGDDVRAFEREAQILKTLDHPGIPRFRASMQTGEGVHKRLYLVQDYIDGVSLATRLEDHRFVEDEVFGLVEQVLEILVYLQAQTPMVFHRDIKPDNLLLDATGKVWLVDFGAARDRGATAGATLVGTFGYMPVEQLGGIVDATTDVYALGATAAHLLSRREPWEFLQDDNALAPLPLSTGMRAWLERAVARKTEGRWSSAEDAREALRRERTPAAVTSLAAHRQPRSRAGRFVGRYGGWLAAAASFVGALAMVAPPGVAAMGDGHVPITGLLLLAALAFYMTTPGNEDEADEAVDPAVAKRLRRRRRRWRHVGVAALCIASLAFVAGRKSPTERFLEQSRLVVPSPPAMPELRDQIRLNLLNGRGGDLHDKAHQLYNARQYPLCQQLFRASAATRGHSDGAARDYYNAACCAARAGAADDAFELLGLAFEHGWDDVEHASSDRDLASLWGDPRWAPLAHSMAALSEEHGHETTWRTVRGRGLQNPFDDNDDSDNDDSDNDDDNDNDTGVVNGDIDLGIDDVALDADSRRRIEAARERLQNAARELRKTLREELPRAVNSED